MDIGIYFDKTDYLGECTLNVIDQVMFIEHYQEVSNYISENYIELKENQFYLEEIEPRKWGVDKLQQAKDLEANKNKGTFIAKAWNFIQRMFLNILGSVLTFFARIANVIIGLLNSKFNWKNIKEYWSSIDKDIEAFQNNDINANELTPEQKKALYAFLKSLGMQPPDLNDSEKSGEPFDSDDEELQTDIGESANFNDLYSYSYFREDAKPGIFTKLINLLPGMQKKVVSGVMESISVLANNNLLIHTVMGSIALKAYVNAIMNLINPSIKSRLNQEYDIKIIGSGQKIVLSYIKILNFFNTNMDQGIWEPYEKYCNAFGYKKMRAYIDKCKITNKNLEPVEEMDPKVRNNLETDFTNCPKIIENLQERCQTFYKLLRSYLDTMTTIIKKGYLQTQKNNLSSDGKDKYANRLEDSRRNNDPGKSGYYKKEFDWETRMAYGDDLVNPDTITPLYGFSSKDLDDEEVEMMRFTDDINELKFYYNADQARLASEEIKKKINKLINGKKDVEAELNSRIEFSKKNAKSGVNTKPAQEIAKFIRKTVAECKDANKIIKYQNVYMDIYDKAKNFIEIAKAKLKLANFDRDYANYQKNNSEINELTQQGNKLDNEYLNTDNYKKREDILQKINKNDNKIFNKKQKKFW